MDRDFEASRFATLYPCKSVKSVVPIRQVRLIASAATILGRPLLRLLRKGIHYAHFFFRRWLDMHHDLFLDLIRVYLGTGLFVKGIYLMMHLSFLQQTIEQSGNLWFAPAASRTMSFLRTWSDALLALGLLTRFAALIQIPVLAGALFYVYLPRVTQLEARQNLEFSALVLFLLVVFAVYGAGRWSLDAYLEKRVETSNVPESAAWRCRRLGDQFRDLEKTLHGRLESVTSAAFSTDGQQWHGE